MSTTTPPTTPLREALRPLLPALALALAALGGVFHVELGSAVRVWNESTAYGHCWLVLPIALWLLRERQGALLAMPATPCFWPALLALPLALLWGAGDLVGVMEARQIAALGFLEASFLALLGPRLFWALSPGLLYLFFLVPFGAFLTPWLQSFTVDFVSHGLDALGIPNRITALQIEIPEGRFFVAEACAGLRFLIASIAFGVLYAVTMFTSPARRILYIALSCGVPIVANGFRALGIVSLGHVLGSAQAATTDHVLYGWIFFSIVILLLAGLGMPLRQDPPPYAPAPSGSAGRSGALPLALATLPILVLAACGPLASWLVEGRAEAPPAATVFATPPDCTAGFAQITGNLAEQNFTCAGVRFTAYTEVIAPRTNPASVVAAARNRALQAIHETDFDNEIITAPWGKATGRFAVVDNQETGHGAAYTLVIGGEARSGGLHDRLALARQMLGSGAAPTVALVVVADTGGAPSVPALEMFLGQQPGLAGAVAGVVGGRR